MLRFVLITLFLLCYHAVPAQQTNANNAHKALALAKQAILLADQKGDYTRALQLMEEARKLDPRNLNLSYEIAYLYYKQKNYDATIKEMKRVLGKTKTPDARYYRLLGNAYDLNKQPTKAINTYKEGIKLFPNAGQLYTELGGMAYKEGDNDRAVEIWEQGIQNAPDFASNYYWAAKLFCYSSEKIWAVLYGELFLLLEPNTNRSAEMSALLYKTYRESMMVNPNSSWQNWVSFSERARTYIMLGAAEEGEKTPFQVAVDDASTRALQPQMKNKDIAAIYLLRLGFLEQWNLYQYNTLYPNFLFDWWQQVNDAGHMEAYTYYIFKNGNETEFEQWKQQNALGFTRFMQWLSTHAPQFNAQHRFYRLQYL